MGVQFPCTQSSEQIINPDGCPLQNPYFAAIPWPFQFWKSTTNNPKTNHYQSYLRQLDIFAWFQRCVRRVILEVFHLEIQLHLRLQVRHTEKYLMVSRCLWGTAAQQCWIMAIYRHAATKVGRGTRQYFVEDNSLKPKQVQHQQATVTNCLTLRMISSKTPVCLAFTTYHYISPNGNQWAGQFRQSYPTRVDKTYRVDTLKRYMLAIILL